MRPRAVLWHISDNTLQRGFIKLLGSYKVEIKIKRTFNSEICWQRFETQTAFRRDQQPEKRDSFNITFCSRGLQSRDIENLVTAQTNCALKKIKTNLLLTKYAGKKPAQATVALTSKTFLFVVASF
jgi:hypothetical protein